MAQRILLVVGVLFEPGSALQTVNEIGQYDELLEALKESDLGPESRGGANDSQHWPLAVKHSSIATPYSSDRESAVAGLA